MKENTHSANIHQKHQTSFFQILHRHQSVTRSPQRIMYTSRATRHCSNLQNAQQSTTNMNIYAPRAAKVLGQASLPSQKQHPTLPRLIHRKERLSNNAKITCQCGTVSLTTWRPNPRHSCVTAQNAGNSRPLHLAAIFPSGGMWPVPESAEKMGVWFNA
jgi:hypothetical protein